MNRLTTNLGMLALALAAGPVVVAQTVTTGAVSGTVTSVAKLPLAGALVRASSGQVTRTATTDAEGRFSIGLMNVGNWQVTVTLNGYTLVRQNVAVSANATAQTTFRMAKEGGATVEVVASSAALDPTTTTTGVNFSMESMAAVPRGRDVTEMAFMTPGVTSGGFTGQNGGLNISMNGASGAENSFSIDGLATNDMRYGGSGVSLVTDFVEQVDVQTGGYKPEYSALGGVFNVVTKSGSNEFAGSAWFTTTPSAFQPGPKVSRYYQEVSAASRYDLGMWVGGALIPDRFFYSVGADFQRLDGGTSANAEGKSAPGARTDTTQLFAKFNYFITSDHQLTLSYFGTPQTTDQPSANVTPAGVFDGLGTQNAGFKSHSPTSNVNLIWDGILTPTMNISVKVGQSKITNTLDPYDSVHPLILDSLWYTSGPNEGSIYSRGGYGLVTNEENKTTQGSADFSWILGTHSLKIGVSTLESTYSLNEHYTGGYRLAINQLPDPVIDGAYQDYLRVRVITNNASVKSTFNAIYAQDTWQATPGLNVFYGFRAESQQHKDFTGRTFLKFDFKDYIQPRLGFTWDIAGNGTSKLAGSYARYYERIPQRMSIREFGGETYYELRWSAAKPTWNNSFTYNPNAANGAGTVTGDGHYVDYSGSFNNPPIMDDIKLPQRDEFQVGFDQKLTDAITVGLHAKYRKLKNAIEDSVITDKDGNAIDGNEMAIIWNPKPHGVSWTDSYSGEKDRVADTYFPDAGNTYTAIDATFEYKTERTYLKASYLWSRMKGNYEGVVTSSNGQPDGNITASFDYWPYVGDGLLPLDRTHEVKIFGYQTFKVFDNPMHVGFNFLWQSGVPYSWWDDGSTSTPPRPDIGQYGDSTPMNGRLGDKGRTPSHAKLDLNLDYEMHFGKKFVVIPMVSVFNVFNSRPVATVLEQATDSGGVFFPAGKWASPTAFYAGRSFQFGIKARF